MSGWSPSPGCRQRPDVRHPLKLLPALLVVDVAKVTSEGFTDDSDFRDNALSFR